MISRTAGVYHRPRKTLGVMRSDLGISGLNPYLLFDAESSMIGTFETPTLDLDPAFPETLDVITAVRAGVASYTDESGLIQEAVANTVRVDHSLGYPAMLIEPSATNLVTHSEDFSNSAWTKTAVTMEGGHTAPDGTATAYKLIEDTSDSVHRTFQTATASVSPSASISVFVKYSGRRYVLIRFADQSVGRWYDLISGTLGSTYLATPNDSSIELVGNDWYRITLSHTSNAQARCEFWVSDTESVSSHTGDGTSGVHIWGAQLEAGSVATSYIPTSGSAVTRADDLLSITGSAFSDFFNGSEGTFYIESVTKKSDGQPFVFSANTDSNNRIVYYNTPTATSVYVATNGVAQANLNVGNRPAAGTLSRGSLSYKINNIEASVDGGGVVSDTSATIPSVNKLTIGSRITGESIYALNGHLKRVLFWPTSSDRL